MFLDKYTRCSTPLFIFFVGFHFLVFSYQVKFGVLDLVWIITENSVPCFFGGGLLLLLFVYCILPLFFLCMHLFPPQIFGTFIIFFSLGSPFWNLPAGIP